MLLRIAGLTPQPLPGCLPFGRYAITRHEAELPLLQGCKIAVLFSKLSATESQHNQKYEGSWKGLDDGYSDVIRWRCHKAQCG
jgi:hypothetical protein